MRKCVDFTSILGTTWWFQIRGTYFTATLKPDISDEIFIIILLQLFLYILESKPKITKTKTTKVIKPSLFFIFEHLHLLTWINIIFLSFLTWLQLANSLKKFIHCTDCTFRFSTGVLRITPSFSLKKDINVKYAYSQVARFRETN